jgi:hypothetical protein
MKESSCIRPALDLRDGSYANSGETSALRWSRFVRWTQGFGPVLNMKRARPKHVAYIFKSLRLTQTVLLPKSTQRVSPSNGWAARPASPSGTEHLPVVDHQRPARDHRRLCARWVWP